MIKIGIAGLGGWGQTLVNSVQGKSDKAVFVAGATGRKERAVDYCAEKNIRLLDSYEDLIADPEIDGVVLATLHSQHTQQIEAAAHAGKPVFVEKPMTLDGTDAQSCADVMSGAGLPLCVGFNRRFLPAMQKLVQVAQDGTLGKLLHIEGNISGNGSLRYPEGHWRSNRAESPAGGMTAMGVHMMDAIISVMGHVKSLRAVSERHATPIDVDDTTFATLKFENGLTGLLTTIFATQKLWHIRVFGDKGWAEVHGETNFELRPLGGEPVVEDFSGFDMNRAELEGFADTIANGTPYRVPTADAVHGIHILNAIMEGAESGAEVQIPK
jgi:predicted dehydrogenase